MNEIPDGSGQLGRACLAGFQAGIEQAGCGGDLRRRFIVCDRLIRGRSGRGDLGNLTRDDV
jgi:hypothetical protein